MAELPTLFDDTTLYLGNTLNDYFIALVIVFATFLVLTLIRIVVIGRISARRDKIKSGALRTVLDTFKKYLNTSLVLILSIYMGIQQLEIPEFFIQIMDFLVLAFIAWLIAKFIFNLLDSIVSQSRETDSTNIHILEFFNLMTRGFVSVLLLLWLLTNLGVDVTSFLGGLAIFSLAIAFALKEILADIFASLVIFIDRPFEVGDSVKLDNDSGTIESIGIRSSRIRATEGYLIVMSNRELTNKRINNLKRMNQRRVSLTIQVSRRTPNAQLKKIPEYVKEIVTSNSGLIFNEVNLLNINTFSYDYELVYYVNTRDIKPHLSAKQEIMLSLLKKFEEENITIPYPTTTVVVEQ